METALHLESLIEEVIRRMGFSPHATVREVGSVWTGDIEVPEGAGALIGSRGEGIDALEDVIRRIVHRRFAEAPRVVLDVNGYRREQAVALRERVREIADRARRFGETYAFQPMPARERRIIHTELAARGDVITESVGEGANRYVVVRPAR